LFIRTVHVTHFDSFLSGHKGISKVHAAYIKYKKQNESMHFLCA